MFLNFKKHPEEPLKSDTEPETISITRGEAWALTISRTGWCILPGQEKQIWKETEAIKAVFWFKLLHLYPMQSHYSHKWEFSYFPENHSLACIYVLGISFICDDDQLTRGCTLSPNPNGQAVRQRRTVKKREPKVLKAPSLAMGPQQLGGWQKKR